MESIHDFCLSSSILNFNHGWWRKRLRKTFFSVGFFSTDKKERRNLYLNSNIVRTAQRSRRIRSVWSFHRREFHSPVISSLPIGRKPIEYGLVKSSQRKVGDRSAEFFARWSSWMSWRRRPMRIGHVRMSDQDWRQESDENLAIQLRYTNRDKASIFNIFFYLKKKHVYEILMRVNMP